MCWLDESMSSKLEKITLGLSRSDLFLWQQDLLLMCVISKKVSLNVFVSKSITDMLSKSGEWSRFSPTYLKLIAQYTEMKQVVILQLNTIVTYS